MNEYSLGFSTLTKEVRIPDIPVTGQLPPWLEGTLVRTGPARYEAGDQRLRHWFDGYAMLHAFSFGGGKVSYANQFLGSRAYNYAQHHGKIGYREFASDPCRAIFKRFVHLFTKQRNVTDNGNVNISKIADQFVALTEIPLPVAFDANTLKTTGGLSYDDALGGDYTTAHPHFDPIRREAVNFLVHFARSSTYTLYRLPQGSKKRIALATIPTKRPAYIHSFGITPNYVILVENPHRVNPLNLLLSGRPFIENYRWNPKAQADFILVHRESGAVTRCPAAPFFAFHHINAFEKDDAVIADFCAYENSDIIKALYLDNLRGENQPGDTRALPPPPSQFRRYTLNPKTGAATCEIVSDQLSELPRINYGRANMHEYRFAYGTGVDSTDPNGFIDRLVKVDIEERSTQIWQESFRYPGEPVFVAAPKTQADNEDAGLILSVVLDAKKEQSFLLVLDAQTFTELARCAVPHHIPFGFHGNFFGSPPPGPIGLGKPRAT